MLREIATLILDEGLGPPWVRDVNFFAGHIPARNINDVKPPPRIMAVLENASPATDMYLKDRIDKPIQIWNRAKTYFTARGDALEVYDFLHFLDQVSGWFNLPDLGEGVYTVLVVQADAKPTPIANPGDDGLYVFSTNYTFKIMQE